MFLLQMFDEEIRNAGEQMLGGVSATDAMVTVGVNVHAQESWENVIKEYNVSGDNVAHYNLPAEQQLR